MLGVTSAMGRLPVKADAATRVVVVTHKFWSSKLGASPEALGQTLIVGSEPYFVIGVLPESFSFALSEADLWMPLTADGGGPAGRVLRVVGRLRDGITPYDAAVALDAVSVHSVPASRAVVRPLRDASVGAAAATLWILMAAAGFALIIALVNLAALLLLRAADRERELAVRAALGAGQWALVRQALVESHVIVLGGTVGGVVFALWIMPAVQAVAAEQLGSSLASEVQFSANVLVVLSAAALLSAWLCGAVPAVRVVRLHKTDMLRRKTDRCAVRGLLGRGLLVGQIAVSFVLLAGLALVGRSLQQVLAVDPGFRTEGIVTMRLSLPAATYRDAASVSLFYRTLQARLTDRLGQAVAVVDEVPLTGDRGRLLVAEGAGLPGLEAVARSAGPDYFAVMGIPLRAGRGFDGRDSGDAPARVIVSAALAARVFSGRDPVGQPLWIAGSRADILGVVGDVKHASLEEGELPTLYFSAQQQPSRSSHIVVRSTDLAGALSAVRREVSRLDGDLPVYAPRPVEELVRMSAGVPARRLLTVTFSAFSTLAVVLAAVGVFGPLCGPEREFRTRCADRRGPYSGPRRAKRAKRYWQPATGSAGYQGQSPWLV